MQIPYFHVDAFASSVFKGNPATVCLLTEWLDEEILQAIASEFNLPATAFVVAGEAQHEIRWFSPVAEKTSCGHATLAAAHVLLKQAETSGDKILFSNQGKTFGVHKKANGLSLSAPKLAMRFAAPPKNLDQALDLMIDEAYQTQEQFILITKKADQIAKLQIDIEKLSMLTKKALLITAPGQSTDFAFRYFSLTPVLREDAVTGTALYLIAPYWAKHLNKDKLISKQLSKRGTTIPVHVNKNLVTLQGQAQVFAQGKFTL